MASSLTNITGRYVKGGVTEEFPNRLGFWERTIMKKQNNDIILTITGDLAGRPDLIAYFVYGSSNYAWLVLQYNTILDIDVDLASGNVITLPSPDRLI